MNQASDHSFEFRTYVQVLWRRWLLIVVLAALAASAAYAYSARAPRIYRATAQLSVTPSVIEFFTGEAVQRLLNNYALRLKSTLFAEQIAARMQPPVPAEAVIGKVRAVASPAEFRIAIEVDDANPVRAQEIANAAALGFVAKIREENAGKERRDITIDVLERAAEPGNPISPRPKRDAFGAALLGALIGGALAFLLEFWDDTIKTADEAAALLVLPVLGAVPQAGEHHAAAGRRPLSKRVRALFRPRVQT
ncbi:MAG: hypothetical protein HY332_03360 [Chloroflexi bacterium]|nr:hypothetical protein [Chloroflexota bacterium]